MATKSCNTSYSYTIILFILLQLLFLKKTDSFSNETDHLALLSFKKQITDDPLQVLNSWNNSMSSICNWTGVTCSSRRARVVSLILPYQKLGGLLSPSIANLTFLRLIDLRGNRLRGEIPAEISYLLRIRYLLLMENIFEGQIPANLSQCSQLRVINFNYNNLTGKIPSDISTLPNLVALHLSANQLTGGIPPVLGNISSLLNLSIAQNFLGGNIPDDLGRLRNLEFLQVSNANLSGTIPLSIFNLSRLSIFSLAFNHLAGNLPSSIGTYFPYLKQLHFGANGFSGVIPISLSNISTLQIIDMPDNNFVGKVPVDLGSVSNLQRLNFGRNYLGLGYANGLDFLDSLINCTKLEMLSIDGNQFSGTLPNKIANLSITMRRLLLGNNQLSGGIPPGITKLVNLNTLNVSWNKFDGPIFPDIGKLFNLRQLLMNGNKFSGMIPFTIGNLTELFEVRLDRNMLERNIPTSIGNCQQLKLLNLSYNNLSGTVPSQLFSLSSLTISLNLASNSLSGSLPVEVEKFLNLKEIDLSNNEFSGGIPDSLGRCLSMEHIFLQGNSLNGSIPLSLSALKGLLDFDLSRNNMTGRIPEFLQDFVFLRYLNLSFNDFEGQVPGSGIFANKSLVSLHGNIKLCGSSVQLELPSCPKIGDSVKRDRSKTLKVAIGVVSGVLGLALVLYLSVSIMLKRSRRKGQIIFITQDWSSTFSYNELEKATNGFSPENLLGEGGFASVYRGFLSQDRKSIAVKVLNLQKKRISKIYMTECEALSNIRHRNLVKILGGCSTVDTKGQDFKAIVLEFMPNGSLEKWLHPNEKNQVNNLSILQRLSIAVDVASALEYLHHYSHVPIAHCDLKPGNVLLDTNLCAHLSDFGLAKFITKSTDGYPQAQTSSNGIRGSFGYVAPEYGMGGTVSIYGDVYSFGILLLEMFTGKAPTDEPFSDGLTLRKFAKNALPDHVMDIIDPTLVFFTQDEAVESSDINSRVREQEIMKKYFGFIIRIGVECSQELAQDRMNIKEANIKLQLIRDNFFLN